MDILKVSAKSSPNSIAGALAGFIKAFTEVVIDGEEKTAIKLIVEPRREK